MSATGRVFGVFGCAPTTLVLRLPNAFGRRGKSALRFPGSRRDANVLVPVMQ